MRTYTRLKAWRHAHRLAVECSKVCRRFPVDERGVLGSELRQMAYAVVASVASAITSFGPHRLNGLEAACRGLSGLEALLQVARELELCTNRDFAKLEAWCIETGKTVQGLRRKVAEARRPVRES